MTREAVLEAVRRALGRRPGATVTPLPVWNMPLPGVADRIARFQKELEAVAGEFVDARGGDLEAALSPLRAGGAEVVTAVAAIAESGSVVIERDGDHGPSTLPEVSVVVVHEDSLAAGLEDVPPPGPDVRARVIVTGPSRTSDIEKKLVLGAHGPKRLVVLLVR